MTIQDENFNSPNEELDELDELATEEVSEDDDLDVLTEKLNKVLEQNKQLFTRTKKAEGFVQGDDGKWAKKPAVKSEPEVKPEPTKPDDIAKAIDAKFEQRELDDLEFSDELKKEVQLYAKLNNVSIKKALVSDYIQFKTEKEQAATDIEAASLEGGRRTNTRKDYAKIDPGSFDLRTKEGKADKVAWEEGLKKQLG
mgnify:CR=1 FL=1